MNTDRDHVLVGGMGKLRLPVARPQLAAQLERCGHGQASLAHGTPGKRAAVPTACVLAATLALLAAAPATADDTVDEWALSPAWSLAGFALNTALTAGAAAGAGWPLDDAMLRYVTGLAAGAAPAGLLLWLWGTPCDDAEWRTSSASCWLESILQGFTVAVLDGAAMFVTMLFVEDVPAVVERPSAGLTAGWTVGWTAGSALALSLPPLVGAPWGDDTWSTIGLFAWGHAAVATVLLAAVYAIRTPEPFASWMVQLPVLAGGW